MNRTLLSLNLGSNLIGDNGASKLAEVRCEISNNNSNGKTQINLISCPGK